MQDNLPRKLKSPSFLRALWICLGLGVASLVVLYFVGTFLLNSWLRSEAFRVFLNKKTSAVFHADGEYQPIQWSGFSVYTDGYSAMGNAGSPFSELRAEQIRAEFNPQGVFHRAWQINDIQVQHFKMGLASMRSAVTELTPAQSASASAPEPSSWIPNRLEIRHVQIQQADLNWMFAGGAGGLQEMRVTLEPDEEALRGSATGGRLFQAGFPTLKVDHLRVRYQHQDLFITDALFKLGESGAINLSGQVGVNRTGALELQTSFTGISTTQFLPEDWRAKLHGNAAGETSVSGTMGDPDSFQASGKLSLNNAQIEALPILDKIAAFTRTVQFRRFTLHTATADFKWSKTKCAVSNLILESQGLIRVEGGFVVEHGNLNGSFMVGVTPTSLRWLPGSQERVFTQERAGFIWTPVQVSGPLNALQEDLSPRLLNAVKEEVINNVNDVKGAVQKGVQGMFDLLKP